jgi:hypothetical protein
MALKLASFIVDAVSSKVLGRFEVKNSTDTATHLTVDNTTGLVWCGGDLDVLGKALIANTFIDTGAYSGAYEGFLIITDIPVTDVMTFLEFTMHAYGSGYPAMGVVQCYPYPEWSEILRPKYTAIGDAPSYCRIFYSNNKLCFWFPVAYSNTIHPVLHTSGGGYKIVSTTAEALPSSRSWEVTANVLLPWSSINQGSGSGLDADLIDGIQGSQIMRSVGGSASTVLDDLTTDGIYSVNYSGEGTSTLLVFGTNTGGSTSTVQMEISWHPSCLFSGGIRFRNKTDSLSWTAWRTIWTNENDGSGSGLDADLLDGQHGSYYVNTSGNQTIGGTKKFTSTIDGDISGNAATADYASLANRTPNSFGSTLPTADVTWHGEFFYNTSDGGLYYCARTSSSPTTYQWLKIN